MPQSRDARKRPNYVRIYLSDQELEKLKALAAGEKLGMSDYLRRLAGVEEADPTTGKMKPVYRRGRRGKSLLPTAPIKVLSNLAWIGNNLNQIARVLNTTKKSGRTIDTVRIAAALHESLGELRNVLHDFPQR
jgi:hypothetical protein